MLQVQSGGAVTNLIAPLSSQSLSLQKATVTQAIRQVMLCKDREGKCGLRLHSVNNGVFICYVQMESPAALAGLRFGDQILEINNVAVAGMSMDQCHKLLKKAPSNGIAMAVRDRQDICTRQFFQPLYSVMCQPLYCVMCLIYKVLPLITRPHFLSIHTDEDDDVDGITRQTSTPECYRPY